MSTALKLTLDEYDRMIAQDAFAELGDKRIELILGELREMSPPGLFHEDVTDRLTRWSTSNTSADQVRVRIQNSIGIPLSASAPEPDVAWVMEKSYQGYRPLPEDVLLVIEVANTSLEDDRTIKGPLYAEAEIAEYWLVKIPEECVEVQREPQDGTYRNVRSYGIGESVRSLAFPEAELPVALLFVD